MRRADWITRFVAAVWTAMVAFVLVGPFYLGGVSVPVRQGFDLASGIEPNVSAPPDPTQDLGVVWLNTSSRVYHYPQSRWFGTTIHGKYIQESDALIEGNRAALNERRPWYWPAARARD